MWNLLGGEKFSGILKSNLLQFFLAVENIDINRAEKSRSKSPLTCQKDNANFKYP